LHNYFIPDVFLLKPDPFVAGKRLFGREDALCTIVNIEFDEALAFRVELRNQFIFNFPMNGYDRVARIDFLLDARVIALDAGKIGIIAFVLQVFGQHSAAILPIRA
jgi:hypothetical protein